jgi:metal-dependent amidase/aminoacylase/carboxypeptidase family protein
VCDETDPTMGGEDFAYFLEDQGGVPGVIFRVGVDCPANQHTSRFDFGSRAILPALRIMAHLTVRFLAEGVEGVA